MIPFLINRGFVRCSNCGFPQEGSSYNTPGFGVCPHCNSKLTISAFPALYEDNQKPDPGDPYAAGSAATCFYHPTRTAVVPCGTCGRYLCALCEIELGENTICPDCMDKAARSENVAELVDERPLRDTIALITATVPILFWLVTVVTAPLAIYMTVRYWRTPISIVPRTRIRFVLAFIIAVIQILAWSAFLFAMLA